MKSSSQQKFLVVSYDDDQQQWFWDYVVARTEAAAVSYVWKRRSYVIAADAASLSQVQGIVSALQSVATVMSPSGGTRERSGTISIISARLQKEAGNRGQTIRTLIAGPSGGKDLKSSRSRSMN
jgi:hypothetical protein